MGMWKPAATLSAVLVSVLVLARMTEGLACYKDKEKKSTETCVQSESDVLACETRTCGEDVHFGCYVANQPKPQREKWPVGVCRPIDQPNGQKCESCTCTNDLCNVPKGDASHLRNSLFTWIWTALLIVTTKLCVN